jgi:putative nucleotidyltransferase with HDIG domain
MLKRIPVDQLRIGMHLHELCGSWVNHPFWRAKFVLSDPADIRRIQESGIDEVWIDTGKGLDVAVGRGVSEVREEVERELESVAGIPLELPPETDSDALDKAAALYRRSRPQMIAMFNEARLGKAVHAESCVPLVDEISKSVMSNPGALISIARLKHRDEYTYMHSVAVCALMVGLARQLGMQGDEVRQAGLAGMLHDIGKALMPLDVLNKPDKLTDAEFAIMRTHPERGHEMLLEGGSAGPAVLDVCLHHHERIDGTGYPQRQVASQLSHVAKMGAVCDVYDATTSDRPYKRGWDPGEALRKMAQWKGHFDPLVFQAFVKTVGIYPIGSLLRLQSGRLAVVMAQNQKSLLTPKVKVFFSTKSNQRIVPEELDLGGPWCIDKVAGCEAPEHWPFTDLDRLWGAPDMKR